MCSHLGSPYTVMVCRVYGGYFVCVCLSRSLVLFGIIVYLVLWVINVLRYSFFNVRRWRG